MTPYERLSAILDDPGNRHGPDRACVPVSVAGGRTRYVWIDRDGDHGGGRLSVTLFGNPIAELRHPDSTGSVRISAAAQFTDCTRDALGWLVNDNRQAATLSRPGLNGGPDQSTPWTLTVYPGRGQSFALSTADPYGWLTIPAEAFA